MPGLKDFWDRVIATELTAVPLSELREDDEVLGQLDDGDNDDIQKLWVYVLKNCPQDEQDNTVMCGGGSLSSTIVRMPAIIFWGYVASYFDQLPTIPLAIRRDWTIVRTH